MKTFCEVSADPVRPDAARDGVIVDATPARVLLSALARDLDSEGTMATASLDPRTAERVALSLIAAARHVREATGDWR